MTAVAHDEAIVVSFAAGKQYYFDAAEKLEKRSTGLLSTTTSHE